MGLFYGQRALCIGALSPLNYVGTTEHTAAKVTPFKRLAHTANSFETVMFGSTAEADRVLDAVGRMHRRVNGTLPETAGPYRAGTPYDAFDPRLMLWTVAVMMDSAERFYDLLVRRLRDHERETLWQDYLRFGELFGMPRAAAPQTYPDFRAYYARVLDGDEVWLTDEARRVGHMTAFEIPMRGYMQPAKRLHDLIMLGSLPPRVRRIYRLPWTPAHAVAFDLVTGAFRLAHPALPAQLARGSNTSTFDGVADIEAWRIATGRPTPQVARFDRLRVSDKRVAAATLTTGQAPCVAASLGFLSTLLNDALHAVATGRRRASACHVALSVAHSSRNVYLVALIDGRAKRGYEGAHRAPGSFV